MLHIVYRNKALLDYGQYRIGSISVNGQSVQFETAGVGGLIQRSVLESLPKEGTQRVEIVLEQK
ncbi:hypothetical protein D3C77_601430 [compost metagenome]